MEYEHSERARYVTTLVSMWIENDGEHSEKAMEWATKGGVAFFGLMCTKVLNRANVGSAAWHTFLELCPNDFRNDRIHWDEIARNLIGE